MHEDPKEASNILQKYIDLLQNWLIKWKIKENNFKSGQGSFALPKEQIKLFVHRLSFIENLFHKKTV